MRIELRTSEALPATRKLFHADPYLSETEAEVLHVADDLVVLDQTVFYAESGGQVADQGSIDGIPVIDVQASRGRVETIGRDNPYGVEVDPVRVDTVTVHRLARPAAFSVGQRVSLRLDWPLRYLHMRNHTASHFLYHAVREVYGREGEPPKTRGCYIHAKSSRFDYFGKLDPERLPEVSEVANDLIGLGRDVLMEPDARTPEVSYWRYEDIVIPCGGTHVRSATELGPIRIKRSSQGKTTDRLYAILES